MRSRAFHVIALAAVLALLPGLAVAQFGHPLKGQWSGEWGPKDNPQRILLDLHWDGKAITGSINPGARRSVGEERDVRLHESLGLEGHARSGGEGHIRQSRSRSPPSERSRTSVPTIRVFHGTWTQGGQKGEFTVTRN